MRYIIMSLFLISLTSCVGVNSIPQKSQFMKNLEQKHEEERIKRESEKGKVKVTRDDFAKITKYEIEFPDKFISKSDVRPRVISVLIIKAFKHDDTTKYKASYVLEIHQLLLDKGCNNPSKAYDSDGIDFNVNLVDRHFERSSCYETVDIDLPSIYMQRLSNKPTRMKLYGESPIEFEMPTEYVKALLEATK